MVISTNYFEERANMLNNMFIVECVLYGELIFYEKPKKSKTECEIVKKMARFRRFVKCLNNVFRIGTLWLMTGCRSVVKTKWLADYLRLW